MRPRILDARRAFERDVLFSPLVAALREGNELQNAGMLDAFDGSFFKGRFFARQPEAMIDVGNDREFGFLFEPELGCSKPFSFHWSSAVAEPVEKAKSQACRVLQGSRAVAKPRPSNGGAGAALRQRSRVAEAGAHWFPQASIPGRRADPRRIALLRKLLEGHAQSRGGRARGDRQKQSPGGRSPDSRPFAS